MGFPRNVGGQWGSPGTWEARSSPPLDPEGGNRSGEQKPPAHGAARRTDGSEASVSGWYRQAKETKCGGTGGWES